MSRKNLAVARTLAPEDILVDSYVAVLSRACEFAPTWAVESVDDAKRLEVHRLWLSPESPGEPLRVVSVCLPFVLVEGVKGEPTTLDVRSCALIEVSEDYAKACRKRMGSGENSKLKKSAKCDFCDSS